MLYRNAGIWGCCWGLSMTIIIVLFAKPVNNLIQTYFQKVCDQDMAVKVFFISAVIISAVFATIACEPISSAIRYIFEYMEIS